MPTMVFATEKAARYPGTRGRFVDVQVLTAIVGNQPGGGHAVSQPKAASLALRSVEVSLRCRLP